MEIWKKLTCFEINPEMYEISNHGRIRNKRYFKEITQNYEW